MCTNVVNCTEERTRKKCVLLHYFQQGIQRSPSDQFDILSNISLIQDTYDVQILNQEYLPREIGTIRSIMILKRKIKDINPDIIHISGVKEGFHCMVAAWLAGCKRRILITHGFEGLVKSTPFMKRMLFRWIVEPVTLILATEVQCNSQFSYNTQMVRLFAHKKSYLIYNFLNMPQIEAPHWRKENHISKDNILVTIIGNMHSGKGYDIVEQVARYYSFQENIRFIVIGDGELKREYEQRNADLIEKGKMYSLGKIPHKQAMQVLSESDIFFLPTRFETLGMVFAEAGYLGIPCIATPVGGVEEIVLHNETGIIVPVDDVKACVEAINKLANDNQMRSRLSKNAQRHVMELFSTPRICKRIMDLYERGRTLE